MIDYKNLTGLDILEAMVDGIDSPVTDFIDMQTYGTTNGRMCFGCAATQVLLLLNKKTRRDFMKCEGRTLITVGMTDEAIDVERAVNKLRRGDIETYNDIVGERLPNLRLPLSARKLPIMGNDDFYHTVEAYRDWLDELKAGAE